MTKRSDGIRWFVDTNVLIYSRDQKEPWKLVRAQEWLKLVLTVVQPSLSPQIVNETCSVLLKDSRTPAAIREVHGFVRDFLPWCDAPLNRVTCEAALDIHARHHLSWWDCALVASAVQVEADYLLSEDLQDGRRFGRLQIVNPFRIAPQDFLASLASEPS